MNTPVIIESTPEKPLAWLAAGRGIAVWQNCNLSSHAIGNLTFTPARQADGGAMPSPGWQYGNVPVLVSDNPEDFAVQSWKEVARIKARPGKYGPPCHPMCKADIPKLDKALSAAGEGAEWRFDYATHDYTSSWIPVVIELPDAPVPLSQFQTAIA